MRVMRKHFLRCANRGLDKVTDEIMAQCPVLMVRCLFRGMFSVKSNTCSSWDKMSEIEKPQMVRGNNAVYSLTEYPFRTKSLRSIKPQIRRALQNLKHGKE